MFCILFNEIVLGNGLRSNSVAEEERELRRRPYNLHGVSKSVDRLDRSVLSCSEVRYLLMTALDEF